jgi:GNAT superfamily N-acetyltransferase
VCGIHAKQHTVCPTCMKKSVVNYTIERISAESGKPKIREAIRQLVVEFWGEEEQLTFDKTFNVLDHAAYSVKVGGKTVAFISFAENKSDLIIVALGVRGEYQTSGIGMGLVERAESEARRLGMKRMLVSTSNDNLPALGFYQAVGFQMFELKQNVIAKKHGRILTGVGGLPVRDELRLEKILS